MKTRTFQIILNILVLLALLGGFSIGEAGALSAPFLGEGSPQAIPTVTGITPDNGFNTGSVQITDLTGSDFELGATVSLTKAGETDIIATNVVVENASWITCDFDLSGAAVGQWNVVVTNPGDQSGQLDNGFTVKGSLYLPVVMNRFPPLPDTPVLSAINNPNGEDNYDVCWSTAYLADTYVLQEDDNAAFSSPITHSNLYGTCWSASNKPVGTYYYRVKAHNSWGDSAWSNVQSTTVVPPPPPQSIVYMINDTGCTLCYEVYGTGIGQKCFSSSGEHYYGTFTVGTYSWYASACCGSISDTDYFGEGIWEDRFYCISGVTPQAASSALQCEARSDTPRLP